MKPAKLPPINAHPDPECRVSETSPYRSFVLVREDATVLDCVMESASTDSVKDRWSFQFPSSERSEVSTRVLQSWTPEALYGFSMAARVLCLLTIRVCRCLTYTKARKSWIGVNHQTLIVRAPTVSAEFLAFREPYLLAAVLHSSLT